MAEGGTTLAIGTADKDPTSQVAARAIELITKQGDFSESLRYLEENAQEDDPSAQSLWARLLLEANKPEQARWRFERAIATGATEIEPYLWTGDALLQQHRYTEAADRFLEAVEIDRTNPRAWAGRGRALIHEGDFDQGISALRTATECRPIYIQAFIELANILAELERYSEAITAAEAAVAAVEQRNPIDPLEAITANAIVGRIALETKAYALAIDQFEKSIFYASASSLVNRAEAQFEIARAHLMLGAAHAGLGHHELALDHFVASSEIEPAWKLFVLRAIAGVRATMGDFKAAYGEVGRMAQLYEDSIMSGDLTILHQQSYAEALYLLGHYEKAEQEYEAIVQALPEEGASWGHLTMVYREHAEFLPPPETAETIVRSEAEAIVKTKAEAIAKSKAAAFRATRLVEFGLEQNSTAARLIEGATLAIVLGEYDKARAHLTKAKQSASSDPLTYLLFGQLEAREGDLTKAATHFAQACAMEPADAVLRVHLGATYLGLGSAAKAEEEFRRVISAAPGNLAARIGLGEAMTTIGEEGDSTALTEAIKHFDEALRLDQTMTLNPPEREGSTRLTPKRRADVYYARGYARVGLYEQKSVAGFSFRQQDLRSAQKDFHKSLEIYPDHYRAQRALDKLGPLLRPALVGQRLPELAPFVVAGLAILIMALVNANFFLAWPSGKVIDSTGWTAGVFGSLLFVVAGLTLPQLLKLKVGGIELEKGAAEISTTLVALQREKSASVLELELRMPQIPPNLPRPSKRPVDHPMLKEVSSAKKSIRLATDADSGPNK